MRLPLDAPGRHDRCGSTGRSRPGPGCDARGARRHAALPGPADAAAAGSTTRPTTRRCCGCRARCARSRSRSCAPTARACPALVNSVLRDDERRPSRAAIRTTVFDATDRRRYEQELLRARAAASRRSRRQLQRSLLPGELPGAPGARHRRRLPARRSRGLEVGGDWYDAFWLDERETVGLVVGDVVGRGIGAAATMGQLRSAVRALASTGLGPGGAARRARRATRAATRSAQMATVVYAQLDLATRRLRYACAGPPAAGRSPPPARRRGFSGRALGAAGRARRGSAAARPRATVALAPGRAVLLYTDGLVERRGEPHRRHGAARARARRGAEDSPTRSPTAWSTSSARARSSTTTCASSPRAGCPDVVRDLLRPGLACARVHGRGPRHRCAMAKRSRCSPMQGRKT